MSLTTLGRLAKHGSGTAPGHRAGRVGAMLFVLLSLMLATLSTTPARAATSETVAEPWIQARLITAENAVPAGAASISMGVDLVLTEGWKTYWRSPGEVGLPPEIDLGASQNVAGMEILWPAPERFTAFGIQNFGYADEVVFPVRVSLEEPGAATRIDARVSVLVCEEVCIPVDFNLSLDLPAGAADTTLSIDQAAADRIAPFIGQVPTEGDGPFARTVTAHVDEAAGLLTVTAETDTAFATPDVFVEMGTFSAFGAPDIRLGADGTQLWAAIPITSFDGETAPIVTIVDGHGAATITPTLTATAPAPPFATETDGSARAGLLGILLVALLGGLILNVMPCVLPVLSIKLASAVQSHGKSLTKIRGGFLASAMGVMAFMWVLAAVTFGLQQVGMSVGWGLQFQNPIFLSLMIVILGVFAASLLGLVNIDLPSGLQTRLAARGANGGYSGDFATGAFAAMLATPCSAPFLGTAIAFALTGGTLDIFLVFTALGLGLALPYFVVAIWPALVRFLPKPGRWMLLVKLALGGLLLLTAAWLIWVLSAVAGPQAAIAVTVLVVALVALMTLPRIPFTIRAGGGVALAIAPLLLVGQFAQSHADTADAAGAYWERFDRSAIAQAVAQGETVFVDITADWCLTCKANKLLVLDRDPVASALAAEGILAMQGDWTRPDPVISRYLSDNNRFGIPFNAVYGPGAPEGIMLSELLSEEAVLAAIADAGARDVASDAPD